MNRNKVDLRLIICDFEDIDHNTITKTLGIDPVYVRIKGEKRNPKKAESPLWENNLWSMNSGLDEYASLEDQMNEMLNIIDGKINEFKPLCLKYYCEFACAVYTYKGNDESTPWIHLDKRYNKIALELNAEFDVDLYVG
ncbi:DUF4279 domain-containing protein [Mucilaginibacter sp. BJC16-A38]|uniref:DUF4279 domain-containing protein n=1 Tax=Mucilaginibacter phenanthrenivorans TaxID=1234842 RepID=UPI0021589DAB|nr:DUF4279 domain-containing protein [Mucilaginibacter phenanthrenivorans]MCR8558569.1 DUF4279 domain-containing protein [Mucilaginibacter phenanthrenivorans]